MRTTTLIPVRALRLHTSAGVHRILSCSIRSIQVNDIVKYMKKIEDIELWLVHRAHERVGDSLYSILNQQLRPTAMLQYLDSFKINILMVTNKIRPYKSQTNHRRQTCDTVNVAQTGVLDVESCCHRMRILLSNFHGKIGQTFL